MSSATLATDPGPRPFYVNENDHGGLLAAITSVLICYTVIFYWMRLYLRFKVTGPFGTDDIWISVGTLFGIIQSALTLAAIIQDNFGRKWSLLSDSQIANMNKKIYASTLFFILALTCSKVSIVSLLARLTRNRYQLIACKAIATVICCWGAGCIFAVALECDLSHPWTGYLLCNDQFTRQKIVAGWNIATEICLLVMPVVLVWRLQMPVSPKIIVVSAFSVRVGCVVAEVFRLYYVHKMAETSDVVHDGVLASVMMQIQVHYGLIAATLPCLKPFMAALNTGYMGNDMTQAYFSSSGSYPARQTQTQSYAMNTITTTGLRGQEVSNERWRPDHPEHQASVQVSSTVEARPESPQSTTSSGSDKMIIRKTEGWTVRYEADAGEHGSRKEASSANESNIDEPPVQHQRSF